jgi:hypothetical protein
MSTKKEILRYLKKSSAVNANIINFIENYPIHSIEQVGNSVIIKGTSDRDWVYISSTSSMELKMIKSKLHDTDRNFAVIEDWMIPILCEGHKIKWQLSTMRLFLPDTVPLPHPIHNTAPLNITDDGFIYANSAYKEYISIEYISERIRNGFGSCIRQTGELIAWGITQDDGAIGFLNVLPKYRNKGYARAITVDIIHKLRANNKIPFVHIEENNDKSMNLALSLGFVKDRVVNWFEII